MNQQPGGMLCFGAKCKTSSSSPTNKTINTLISSINELYPSIKAYQTRKAVPSSNTRAAQLYDTIRKTLTLLLLQLRHLSLKTNDSHFDTLILQLPAGLHKQFIALRTADNLVDLKENLLKTNSCFDCVQVIDMILHKMVGTRVLMQADIHKSIALLAEQKQKLKKIHDTELRELQDVTKMGGRKTIRRSTTSGLRQK
jgi:hypothetical protein